LAANARIVTSAGVLVLCEPGEILLGHATGSRWWDIPKGLCEAGEQARDAAVRECREEFGLDLAPGALVEIGHFAYRRGKDLELFAVLAERIDPATLTCTSTFRDRRGRVVPEMDRFRRASFAEVPTWCAPAMVDVLVTRNALASAYASIRGRRAVADDTPQ
jgi:8-oxo-dGTP pyrophosphatase MutT (NUDIX family)